MSIKNDKRVVLTLDAGGTNFVFSAIKGGEEIIEPIRLDPHADDLKKCMDSIIQGFSKVKNIVNEEISAISFAFPGPADYPRGIIGDLPNFPSFRGGVALGPMLEEKFNLPVFINNDGDLFVYGEAIAGILPEVNQKLEEAGSPKRFKNLFGITLGTGFGAGIVRNNDLYIGDNAVAAEIWLLRNKLDPSVNAEEGSCIRAIKREYAKLMDIDVNEVPQPKDIYEIGMGLKEGNKDAAVKAFAHMSEVVGDALSNAITLLDGLIVVGGGISGAHPLFMPMLVDEMNSSFDKPDGKLPRLIQKVFNLEDENSMNKFLTGEAKEIEVYGSEKKVSYDPLLRTGVGVSKLGTSKAVAIGAYSFALNKLDE